MALGLTTMGYRREWILTVLAVLGAFILGGVGGSAAATTLGIWSLPAAGFGAAFSVVVCAYWAAPLYKLQLSAVVLLIGAKVAWGFLGDGSYYPENYRNNLGYEPTFLPLWATYAGGLIAIAAVVFTELRKRRAHELRPN